MCNQIEHLPQVLKWKHEEMRLCGCNYQTMELVVLYWHDGLDLIRHLFPNPAFANSIEYDAFELIDPATNHHVYSRFMSAQYAW